MIEHNREPVDSIYSLFIASQRLTRLSPRNDLHNRSRRVTIPQNLNLRKTLPGRDQQLPLYLVKKRF